MIYLGENIRQLRKRDDLTQENVAEMLNVSPQSVSKWERGDTFPDITLLPALANLYCVSVDTLLGMERINNQQTKNDFFIAGQRHLRDGNVSAAIDIYYEALKTFPNDEGIMSNLAMALALDGDPGKLSQAIALCERVFSGSRSEKVCHTTRAALCFIYLKSAEKEKAIVEARQLPHLRESREMILPQLESDLSIDEINSYLKFIAIGEEDEQDIVTVDFGIEMIAICTEHDLVGKIRALREEIGAPPTIEGYRVLPQIRIRDNHALLSNQVRVRSYADYLLDREYDSPAAAMADVIEALRRLARMNGK